MDVREPGEGIAEARETAAPYAFLRSAAFPEPAGIPPHGNGRRLTGAVLGIGLVVLILMLASAGVFIYRSSTSAAPGSVTTSQPATTDVERPEVPPSPLDTTTMPETTTPGVTSSEPTGADPETQALADLQRLRDTDVGRVHVRGQWVAQLASKWVGATDPLQVNASGSHRFGAADILAEHQSLVSRFGSSVLLLLSTDYGKRQTGPGGQPLWVTFFVGRFADEQAVQSWCAEQFSDLTGAELANACAARRLRPPT